MEITIIPTSFLCLIILLGNFKLTESHEQLPEKQVIPTDKNVFLENNNNDQSRHSRLKRTLGFYPYDPYYRPPLPIIVGVGGFGFGGFGGGYRRGFGGIGGRGFGRFGGRGFGGFGGRGFGGRGFGGRGFGGGFGGRGFGGFGGRGRG